MRLVGNIQKNGHFLELMSYGIDKSIVFVIKKYTQMKTALHQDGENHDVLESSADHSLSTYSL